MHEVIFPGCGLCGCHHAELLACAHATLELASAFSVCAFSPEVLSELSMLLLMLPLLLLLFCCGCWCCWYC
jgi:hypothetical protein